jgi:hypothetical protein
MADDGFVPQTGGLEVKEGHEESDLSTKAIFTFLIVLAVSGALTFVLGRVLITDWKFVGLGWWEKQVFPVQPALTPAQQQLQDERQVATARAAARSQGEGERAPESYGRPEMEDYLGRTFPAPRLQYDDVWEMATFRGDEDKWLASSGKTAGGNIHIPIDQAKDLLVKQSLGQITEPFVPPTLPSAVPLVPATAAPRGR